MQSETLSSGAAPGKVSASVSSQSVETVDSPASAQERLRLTTVVDVPKRSPSRSSKHSSWPSQFWSISSPAISVAPGLIAASASLQSVPAVTGAIAALSP